MNDTRSKLLATFNNQLLFSREYSPLYASFFASMASCLEGGRLDPVGSWLVEASGDRQPLDVSLLLAAGLHRDVLLGQKEISKLAQYYPSVGGQLTAGYLSDNGWHVERLSGTNCIVRSLRGAISSKNSFAPARCRPMKLGEVSPGYSRFQPPAGRVFTSSNSAPAPV